MTHRFRFFLVPVALGMAGAVMAQASSDPLVKQDFKDSQGGWVTMGSDATVGVTHDAPVVAPGEGALKFGYSVKKGGLSILAFPVQVGTLTRAKSLRFRVRADASTMVAVMIQKQDGGRFVAVCMAPKDVWQPIELSVDDFALSQDPGDPKDPDGKLDMDKVGGIMVTDVAQVFAQSDDEGMKTMLGIQTGSHSLYLDEFTVSPDLLPTSLAIKGNDIELETFVHPQLAWYPLGGGELTKATGGPLVGMGLKYAYHQAPGKVSLIAHSMAPGVLAGTRSLSVDFASEQPARLIVQIEQTDGGKFSVPVDLEGGPASKHFVLAFDNFHPTDDSAIHEGKPDMWKVKTLMIMDLSGPLAQADHDNILWAGHLVAHR